MEEGLAIQISAIFVLFLASCAGVSFPIMFLTERMLQLLPLLNALAAGVMLGLALVIKLLFAIVQPCVILMSYRFI